MLALDTAQESASEYRVALQRGASLASAPFQCVFVGCTPYLFPRHHSWEESVGNSRRSGELGPLIFPITRHFACTGCHFHEGSRQTGSDFTCPRRVLALSLVGRVFSFSEALYKEHVLLATAQHSGEPWAGTVGYWSWLQVCYCGFFLRIPFSASRKGKCWSFPRGPNSLGLWSRLIMCTIAALANFPSILMPHFL